MKKASSYVRKAGNAQIFDNSFSEAFPQTDIAKICEKHIRSGERKKVLLIAFDAVRSDALLNIVASTDKDKYANLKYKYGNRHFWAERYYVSTVGLNEATIRKYIEEQEKHDIALDKLSVREYEDPFKGSK